MLAIACLLSSAISNAADDLPLALLRVPDSVPTVFVAETSSGKFHRFDQGDAGLRYSDSFYMSIGQLGPGKERSGDKRTPLGIYFVTEQLETSRLHEKYGVTAFPLDYPNAWDLRKGRDGDGIWIHGVDRNGGVRPLRDTDGCIALPNDDLFALIPRFIDNVTPVIVTKQMAFADADERAQLGRAIEARIGEWLLSRIEGDVYAYVSLYDDSFNRWGMNKSEWTTLILTTQSPFVTSAKIDDLLLLGYPDEEGLYLSRFNLKAQKGGRETNIATRLFWRRGDDGSLTIIAEDVG